MATTHYFCLAEEDRAIQFVPPIPFPQIESAANYLFPFPKLNLSESCWTTDLNEPLLLGVKEERKELVDAEIGASGRELPAFSSFLYQACKFSMCESTRERRRSLRLKALAGTPQEALPDKDHPKTKGYLLDYPWQGQEGMSGRKRLIPTSMLGSAQGRLQRATVPSPSKTAGIWTPDTLRELLLK